MTYNPEIRKYDSTAATPEQRGHAGKATLLIPALLSRMEIYGCRRNTLLLGKIIIGR